MKEVKGKILKQLKAVAKKGGADAKGLRQLQQARVRSSTSSRGKKEYVKVNGIFKQCP